MKSYTIKIRLDLDEDEAVVSIADLVDELTSYLEQDTEGVKNVYVGFDKGRS